jgi:hypothetical protein
MSDRPPRVSIVVPNFNYARYLPERLESLLSQTIRDLEVIIIDDASTDDSLAVIERYGGDPRLRIQTCPVNSGHAYVRWNDGARLARAPYLLFAGADDSCEPRLIEELLAPLEASSSTVLSFCDSLEIDEVGRPLGLCSDAFQTLDPERWKRDFDSPGGLEACHLLYANTIPNASAVLMRRDRFWEEGGFDTSFRLCSDWMLWARLLRRGDLSYRKHPLNRFRKHSGTVRGATARDGLMLVEQYRIVDYLAATFPDCRVERSRALQELATAWWRWTLWEPGRDRLRRSLRLYRAGARHDRILPFRLLRTGVGLARHIVSRRIRKALARSASS